jgi:hypothetical protein
LSAAGAEIGIARADKDPTAIRASTVAAKTHLRILTLLPTKPTAEERGLIAYFSRRANVVRRPPQTIFIISSTMRTALI